MGRYPPVRRVTPRLVRFFGFGLRARFHQAWGDVFLAASNLSASLASAALNSRSVAACQDYSSLSRAPLPDTPSPGTLSRRSRVQRRRDRGACGEFCRRFTRRVHAVAGRARNWMARFWAIAVEIQQKAIRRSALVAVLSQAIREGYPPGSERTKWLTWLARVVSRVSMS
jgi:hypothetical protein